MPPVPADPDAPVGAPLYPPADWFSKPASLQPGQKITVVTDGPDAGRVFGYVAPKAQCILSGREKQECWQVPDSPSNYAAAMQGETLTAEGELVRTANIGGDVDHAPIAWRSFAKVRDHYANTASQIMRVAYGSDEHGVWAAGALWPEITHRQAAKVRASALSGDWRWREEMGAYDMAGSQMVSTPGLPLIPTIHARAASLGDPHPALIGGWGGQLSTEEPMDEPTVTLTLTASETARLHALLSGTSPLVAPQRAAAGACACGAHAETAAAGDMVPMPGEEGTDGGAPVTRAEFDALALTVQELQGEIMANALGDVDARVAAMPLPPDLADEARWAMPAAASWDESKHPRDPKGGTTGGRFRALVRAMAEEPGRVDPNDPRIEEAMEEGGASKGKVVEQVNMVQRRIENGTDADFEETFAKSMSDRENDDTFEALGGRGPIDIEGSGYKGDITKNDDGSYGLGLSAWGENGLGSDVWHSSDEGLTFATKEEAEAYAPEAAQKFTAQWDAVAARDEEKRKLAKA